MPVLITLLYGTAALLGGAFAFMELRMLWRFLRNRAAIRSTVRSREGRAAGDARSAPTVTIQIPLYNERTAAEQIILAAAAQDYPRDRFDIQVLDDSTDETREIVARLVGELCAQGVRIEHLEREHRRGYKAGALAEGLERSRSELLAVFDADFAPEPSFLRRLVLEERAFDDLDVAFVQSRWSWGMDDRLLPAALGLLLDRHYFVEKPTRAFVGNVTTFNGSGGIWRRAAIDDAGGWASDTLTEDLDLSYRCALAGWKGRYMHDVIVLNELPGHMRAFKLQQRRWARGNAQCFRKLTGRVMSSNGRLRDRWDEAFVLAGYAIHPLLLASLLLWPWAVVYVPRTVFWILQGVMSLGMLVAFLSFTITLRERDQGWSLASFAQVLTGLCVGMGLMVNNTVGQIQGFLRSGGEFARTPKGLRAAGNRAIEALGAVRPYSSPLHWTFFAELLVIAYCVSGAAFLIQQGEALWSIPMVFWGICLGLMVQQQMAPRLA